MGSDVEGTVLVGDSCRLVDVGAGLTEPEYSRTSLTTKMLVDCSFLTKNCSSGSSELTKVSC